MLDVITKGRVFSGMVVGTGMEYFLTSSRSMCWSDFTKPTI